jgi:hypothetical protein
MSDIKDMINHAFNKDASDFEASFNSVMAGKVEDALSAKFDSMYGEQPELDLEPEADIDVDSAEPDLESE